MPLTHMIAIDPEDFNTKLRRIGDAADSITKLVGLGKWFVGVFVALVLAIGGAMVWLNGAASALAANKTQIEQLDASSQARLKEWTAWREQTNAQLVRQTAILENQQRLMERLDSVYRVR